MAPLAIGTHNPSSVRSGCPHLLQSLRRARAPGRCPSRSRSHCSMTVQAAAAVSSALKVYEADSMDAASLTDFASRPRVDFQSILDRVGPIVESVRARGDEAVNEYTQQFDKAVLSHAPCRPIEEFAAPELDETTTAAFEQAYQNIKAFHEAQHSQPITVETMPGVRCSRISRPIGAVGLYVPGGTAVLPSTALMLAVPAGIAGCKTIVLATPPRPDGSISPEVLWCAKRAGVTHILQAGGAQAVAAMAHGTASCPKVDKLLGPGNQYVTAAKMLLQNSEAMVSIDMPAGPSEVLVIADGGADPAHVAADLLSQAEHGVDSQVVLLALPGTNVDAIQAAVEAQCAALPRGDVAAQALSHSCVVRVSSKQQAADLSNLYAPEHLIINTEDAETWLDLLDNAGSVFLGRWTPESVGDYASGTNHTLPTYGYARMYSGVSLDSFLKKITVQQLSKEGLAALGPTVAHMAAVEGLDAHRRAVTLRLGLD